MLVERGELSEAAQAFRELGDYADSGELAEKCNTYIRAQTVGSPFTKYKLYNNLGGFLDSSRQAQAQIPEIYDTALEHYGENRFSAAMEWLEIIPDYENYEDAFVYVEACKAHTVLSENYYKMTREVQNALEMLEWSDQYIDVEPICMDRYLIDYFLDGTWVAVDGDVLNMQWKTTSLISGVVMFRAVNTILRAMACTMLPVAHGLPHGTIFLTTK